MGPATFCTSVNNPKMAKHEENCIKATRKLVNGSTQGRLLAGTGREVKTSGH